MAGNIVHAIGTTNAMVAGLQTIEALKLLADKQSECRSTAVALPSDNGVANLISGS